MLKKYYFLIIKDINLALRWYKLCIATNQKTMIAVHIAMFVMNLREFVLDLFKPRSVSVFPFD